MPVCAGWKAIDAWEIRFIPDNPADISVLNTVAVYSAIALPAVPILMSDDPWYDAALYGTSLAVAHGSKELFKRIFGRTRPDGGDRSFPSGHAAGAAVSFGFLLYMNQTRETYHPGYIYASIPLQGTSAAGRVLMRRHYPTDVIAGFLLGTAVGILVPMGADALFNR